LCQDVDWDVRHCMCRHLALISRYSLIMISNLFVCYLA
jgi:hypothetical protein